MKTTMKLLGIFLAAFFIMNTTANSQNLVEGMTAPEIEERSPDGNKYKLSDLRGKLVLIDFWAAWCGPCRRENPNVVSAYTKYKDKNFNEGNGFTVFSVSLDQTKEAWETGIAQDNLYWPYHVSDLEYWYSKPASDYGVRGIPTNYLIDKNGVIIAKNLRGQQLHDALQALLDDYDGEADTNEDKRKDEDKKEELDNNDLKEKAKEDLKEKLKDKKKIKEKTKIK